MAKNEGKLGREGEETGKDADAVQEREEEVEAFMRPISRSARASKTRLDLAQVLYGLGQVFDGFAAMLMRDDEDSGVETWRVAGHTAKDAVIKELRAAYEPARP